jgi:diguanylate cyclase (GGDEF)-like protein/PAS domain S-box-containing protein
MDYQQLFRSYPVIMLLIDPDTGRVLDGNQEAVTFYGYPWGELTALHIQDINQLHDHQILDEMKRAKEEERNYFHFPHRKKNGSVEEVEVHSYPLIIEEKQVLVSTIYQHGLQAYAQGDAMRYMEAQVEGVLVLDHAFRVIRVNSRFEEIFGYSQAECIGKEPCELFHLAESEVEYSAQVQAGQVTRASVERLTKSGKKICVEINGVPLLMREKYFGAYLSYRDVTEKKQYEERLQLFANVLENNKEGVLIIDKRGTIEWVNAAMHRLFGYLEAEMIGKNVSLFQSGRHSEGDYNEMLETLLTKKQWEGELWARRNDGRVLPVSLLIHAMLVQGSSKYIAIIRDVSAIKRKEKEIYFLAYRDSLTRLYNRNYFLEYFSEALAEAKIEKQSLGLLYMDLNGFKAVNDTLGHEAGDRVLEEFSTRLQKVVRSSDCAARYGGDEFVLLMPNLQSPEHAKQLTERLIKAANQPYRVKKVEVQLGVSVGIVSYPQHEDTVEGLLHRADLAMYEAKQRGKSAYYYPEESAKELHSSPQVQIALSECVQNDFSFLELRWKTCCAYSHVLQLESNWHIEGMEGKSVEWQSQMLSKAGVLWAYVERVFDAIVDQRAYLFNQKKEAYLLIDIDESILIQDQFAEWLTEKVPKEMLENRMVGFRIKQLEVRRPLRLEKEKFMRLKAMGVRLVYPFVSLDEIPLGLVFDHVFDAIDLRGVLEAQKDSPIEPKIQRFLHAIEQEGIEFLPKDVTICKSVE